ncbi:MAG: hypothetical protein A4E45_01416 [Methanosaeta sp. PtaB.Bin039]|nr:MAG: hypothetical protein A4E45_01416 [Methanosaeta sp. PtaB.Bin039]
MKALFALTIMLMTLAASAYTFHMPVEIDSTTTPEVLMPGDTAVLAIHMENGAAEYGVGGENARGATVSTPVQRTDLEGSAEIEVLSGDFEDVGLIGPTDRVVLYYKIRAEEDIPDGTYFLNFTVHAGYDKETIGRRIPVRIDSSGLGLARADSAGISTISLNVANPRANTLNAVTIVPEASGVTFSPEEYYVGTMDPDEVFTISFRLEPSQPNQPIQNARNLSFYSRFKNGDTWHRSEKYNTTYSPAPAASSGSPLLPAAGVAALLLVGAAIFIWRRRLSKAYSAGKEA